MNSISNTPSIPRDKTNDYTEDMFKARRDFIDLTCNTKLKHTGNYSFDPEQISGNAENVFGVTQIPTGLAGPLLVNGEHANGEFYVPLATVEGTLIASYNRGMKVIRESGGVKVTVQKEAMQRAPCFIFESAREARDFEIWLQENFDTIKQMAEQTTSKGKLIEIETYLSHHFVWCRFNYTTGDAAGQNMTSKATFFACEWIRQQTPTLKTYMLAGNFDTEKKASAVNFLGTRGRRVTAEIIIPKDVLKQNLRISPHSMHNGYTISTLGSFMSGSSSNAAHPANGLAALYLATGQDVANIGESHQCSVYNSVTREGDLHFSVTLPSIIIATYGGGTSGATQRECLEIMDCYGADKALKLAEIAAALVVAGELSLGAATKIDKVTRKSEWVDAHDDLGRNR